MKKVFGLLAGLLLVSRLWAVSPVPYTEGVSFSFRISGVGNGIMTVYDETGSPACGATASGPTIESNVLTAWLRPGKQYSVNFQASGPGNYWLSFIAPTGYAIYINGISTDLIAQAPGGGWYSDNYTLEIRPVANSGHGAASAFSGIDLGKSVTWEVGLGGLRTGRSAGSILFKELDLTNSPASRDRLYYSVPSNYGQVTVVYDGSSGQTLRQVSVPQTVIDLVDDSGGGYWLKFYTPSQATWSSTLYTFTGSPWKTIRVQSPGTSQLTVTETEGAVSRVSALALSSGSVSSGAYLWTLQEGDGTTWLRTTTHTSTVPSSGLRDDIAVVRTLGASGTIVAKTKYHYVTQTWGEEITQIIADPDTAALTTTYDYYTTSTDYGNYRKVKSVTDPTGNWVGYIYLDPWDYRGQVLYELHPYLDSPSTVTMNTVVCRVFAYSYSADWTGRYRIPSSRVEYNNSVVTSQAYTTPTLNQTDLGQYYTIYQADAYANSTTSQRTISEIMDVRTGNNPDYNGLIWSVKRPDSSQDSCAHYQGAYNYSTKVFTYGGSDFSHFRSIVWHGSTSSSGATGFNGYDGIPFTLVYLIPYQSTMDITIRNPAGNIVHTETQVYTGGSSFSLIASEDFTYDGAGRLTSRVASNGATLTNTYTNGQFTSTVDSTGTETDYTYDLLGRIATSVKKGASAGTYAAQGDITNTNTYDGANHVTQVVTSGGSLSLTSSSAYDLAGRPTSSTAPGSYATSFAYTSSGKIVTTTLPSGATRITETYIDGQPKSLTGTAVVAQYTGFTVNSTPGTVTRQDNFGASTSTALVMTTTDWLGRKITEVKPGWSGSNVTSSWFYNSSGQLYKVSRPGLADTLYSYDTLGGLVREGLDINANGALDLSSSDRITDHAWTFFTNSSNWWRRETASTYATASSGTATQVGKTETQLNGFSAAGSGYTRLNRADSYDVYGNVTTTYTEVLTSSKLAVTTTVLPSSSTNAVQTAYNGLLMSVQDTTGVTMNYGYDALGRQATSVDPRTGTTTTAYVSGTSQVYTLTDPASIIQATYTYDSAGRVSSVKNALNKYAYTSYTNRGEVYHQWGDTTYPVEYTYDNWGHQTAMSTYRGGSGWTSSTWPASPGTADTTTWSFQEATGLLSSKTDATGKAVTYTYTQAGQIATRLWARILSGSTHVTTTYGYDSNTGELTSVTYNDSLTANLAHTYNRLGQKATVADWLGTRTFTYNLAGTLELQSEDLANAYGTGINLYYTYATSGVIGRSTGFGFGTSSNHTAVQSVVYGYGSDGRLNSVAAGGQTFGYGYATNSHLIATVTNSGANYTDTRAYDAHHDWTADRKTQISSASKAEFAYTPDNLGRVTQVAKTGEVYNPYGNGTEGLTTYYGYDDRSQLTSEVTKVGTGSTVLTGRNDSAYVYDTIGNRSSTTHNGNSTSYTINALNQYSQRDVIGAFDVAGSDSATTVTVAKSGGPTDTATRHGNYFFDAYALTNASTPAYASLTVTGSSTATLPAYVEKTPQALTYDDDGNLASDGRWNYTYDGENRLRKMETTAAAVTAGVTRQLVDIGYDYLGRRFKKAVSSGWNGSSYTSVDLWHRYAYNGWNLIAETDMSNSNVIVRNLFWGLDLSGTMQGAGGVGGLLMTQEGGNSYLPVYDGMGNVHGMIKASDGSLAAAYEYDAFGKTLRESGTYAASNPFQYSTKYTDLETGLVYYGLRYYSPTLGRFINKDPIEEKGGLNLYAYCLNNAVNHWDYLGNIPTDDDMAARWRHINFGAANREGAALGGNVFMGPTSDAIGQQEANAGVFNGPAPVPTGNKHMSNAGSAGAGSEGSENGVNLVRTNTVGTVTTTVVVDPTQFGDTVPEYYNEPTQVAPYEPWDGHSGLSPFTTSPATRAYFNQQVEDPNHALFRATTNSLARSGIGGAPMAMVRGGAVITATVVGGYGALAVGRIIVGAALSPSVSSRVIATLMQVSTSAPASQLGEMTIADMVANPLTVEGITLEEAALEAEAQEMAAANASRATQAAATPRP